MGTKTQSQDTEEEPWKVPFWQRPCSYELAAHPDGPLCNAVRDGYLQKRAGKSRLRWNIRFFEIKEGRLKWWRPRFKDQIFQSGMPRVALAEPRPAPVRDLDLTKIEFVTRTRVKFPYSTRIMLRFTPSYTDYQLELRAEREIEIMEWYKLLSRFTMEHYEVEQEREDTEEASTAVGSDSDDDYVSVPNESRASQATSTSQLAERTSRV